MRILVLGGTGWLGGTVVRTALARGHSVTCLARGTVVPPGAALVRADRDADDALSPVASAVGGRWDAVVDVASDPRHVRRAVRDLEAVASTYLFVSTASVYASQADPGADEGAPRLSPLPPEAVPGREDYGPAKVACEDAVLAAFGPARSTVVRPGLIGGPGDASGRTGWWPWRFARPAGGRVLVPDVPDLPTAVLDVRDLAAWLVGCLEGEILGVIDAAGDAVPLGHHLGLAHGVAAEVTGRSGAPVAVSPQDLLARSVAPWAGPRSLPLWLPDRDFDGMSARSLARAHDAGLRPRPLAETLTDALRWELTRPEHPHGAGLTDADELALLDELG